MSFINYAERNPYLNSKYSHSTHHLFHEYASNQHLSPTYNVYEPPMYGTRSFNQKSFVPVPAKKTNMLVALIVGGVLLSLGILSAVVWYFISTSNCIPCGKSDGCVSPSHWCDGIPQCRYGEDEECFLLANSTFVLYAKSVDYGWRPVCHDHWNADHGEQVCNRIGYSRNSYSYYGSTSASTVESSEFLMLNESLSTIDTYQKLSISQNCSSGLLVTLHCVGCGVRMYVRNVSERIVGGQVAAPKEFPWQVSLHLNNRHICGGAILTPDWVITAAHCGERHPFPSHWLVYGGILQQSETHVINPRSVDKFIIHEKFNKVNKDYDIALLKLKSPFMFSDSIRPVCLPNYGQTFPTGSICWISGWGDLWEGGTGSFPLLVDELLDDTVILIEPIFMFPDLLPFASSSSFLQGGDIDAEMPEFTENKSAGSLSSRHPDKLMGIRERSLRGIRVSPASDPHRATLIRSRGDWKDGTGKTTCGRLKLVEK
ncbi:transmembrane protease serine 2-like [Rhincodon typus]|uniref:transmembrane protease serine 2-like n=1 Tax=Rhincodon typus TaxID=259920 RepID=UPI00202E2746|nr:transmembrane protease serine 2-like [Rhincodon typus]